MRLSVFFLCLMAAQAWAIDSYSQVTRISLNMKDSRVIDVLGEIEEKSEFFFLFNQKLVDVERKVDIDARQRKIEDILAELFAGTNVSYLVMNRQIVLTTAQPGSDEYSQTTEGQQQSQVTGRVTDSSGQPLPGVTVAMKGTTRGTITDAGGNYSLQNIPSDATLVFSFVGMRTQEILVAGKASIDVTMAEDAIGIEEVVAIGYGTVRKKDLTGSITSVQGETLSEKGATQLSQALQGTMSGLMVTRSSGFASQEATVKVRGITTINDSDPLVIIDGIPGSLRLVHPNDVENISVLKDAASAAIYGSRAASGVILITTKRASTGVSLNYDFEYGIEVPTKIPENETAVEYMSMYNEMIWNDSGNKAGNEYNTYSKDLIENYASLNKENPDKYPDVDWMELMLNDFAPRQSHVFNLNAGSNHISTRVSIAYDNIDAVYDNRGFERFTIRANNDVTINKYLSTTIDLNYIRSIDSRPIMDFGYVDFRFPPIYTPYWSNGTIGPANTTGLNYYPVVKGDAGFNNNWNNRLSGKISVDLKPFEGIKLSGIFSPAFNYLRDKKYVNKVPYYNSDNPNLIAGYIQPAQKTSLREGRNESNGTTIQFLANYMKDIGVHHFNVMAGFENYYNFAESIGASRDQFEIDNFPYLNLGPLTYRDNSGSASEFAYRSWFGRILYNFKDKYLFQANCRYDGSSRFAEEYRWGFFPSFSAGWVLSEESFIKNIKSISFLKIRTSWGKLGNDRIGTYPYQSTVSFGNALFYQGSNINSSQTSYVSKYAIRDISWENTESYDIGMDINFFSNKLKFTGDYYKKTTKDMLLAIEIPDYMGFDNPDQNTGEMYTKGWDAELGWNDMIGDFKYSVSFNLSDFKSIMGDLGGTQFLGSKVKFKGSEFNEWYGYLSDGLYQTKEEVTGSAAVNATVSPGDIRYKDVSGPTGAPDGKISPEYDRVLLGGSLPRYMYGGNIRLDYKNLDFSLIFQGVGKQNAYITYSMVQPRYAHYKLIQDNHWSLYNTEEQNKKVKFPRYLTSADNSYVTSDFWLFNGAYFRLKNVTLGYSIPSSIMQKVQIKSTRIYASITDLLSFDNYPAGYDPEGSTFFITKSFVFGISLNF